jgi:hypothetical protein
MLFNAQNMMQYFVYLMTKPTVGWEGGSSSSYQLEFMEPVYKFEEEKGAFGGRSGESPRAQS